MSTLLVKLARTREPGLPMFMLGHSAGGVIACNYVLDHQADFAGLVCESFAYRVPAPDFALSVLKGLSHLAPHAHVLKLKKEDFSRDPKVTRALLDDPLLADEVQPTKTVAEMVRADERLKRDFGLFTLPVLIIHGTKDTVTRPEGSKEFYEKAGSRDKTLKLYEGYCPRSAERHRQGSGDERHPELDRGSPARVAVLLERLEPARPRARDARGRAG